MYSPTSSEPCPVMPYAKTQVIMRERVIRLRAKKPAVKRYRGRIIFEAKGIIGGDVAYLCFWGRGRARTASQN